MIEILKNNTNLARLNCDTKQLSRIRSQLTSIDPKARYKPPMQRIVCPVTALGGFAIPIIADVVSIIKQEFPDEELQIDPALIPHCKPGLSDCQIPSIDAPGWQEREHQIQAAEQFLHWGRGLIIVPTRGGKSAILFLVLAAIFSKRQNMKTALLIVPNTSLIIQMVKDFSGLGADQYFGVIEFSSNHAGKLTNDPERPQLIISNAQWLRGHSKELPNAIDFLMVDEVQQCRVGSWISKFVTCFSTPHKLGCTATLPDSDRDQWNAKKLFGSIIYSVPVETLIDAGYIVKPVIQPIKFGFYPKPKMSSGPNVIGRDEYGDAIIDYDPNNPYDLECRYLAKSDAFHTLVADLIVGLNLGNRIVMFDRTAHGKAIFKAIDSPNKYYIDGKIKTKEREQIRELMSVNHGAILVANAACLGVGITIKSLHSVFMLSLQSASTSVLQRIGRGLAMEEGKDAFYVFDIFADLKYSRAHFEERCKLYKSYYDIEIKKDQIKSTIIKSED